jgi:NosR/NirI family transcriptional regulator, nitrous oxide reductase regulator
VIRTLARYGRWLHTRWPAGAVEKLPLVREDGRTNVAGVRIAGDLTGIPLLKFALHSGARAARSVARELAGEPATPPGALDLVIVGAGVAGMAAAIEAQRAGLTFEVLEANEPFATVADFPRAKPIYTYPRAMVPDGELQVRADIKEELLAELRRQADAAGIRPRSGCAERIERRGGRLVVRLADGTRLEARRALVAVGRSGAFRRLGVPGEGLDKVHNRLHDPNDFAGRRVLVAGGGDAAAEAAVALTQAGAHVTLCHRGAELSRPKTENLEKLSLLERDPEAPVTVEQPSSERVATAAGPFSARAHPAGSLAVRRSTRVVEIGPGEVVVATAAGTEAIANDTVFTMIGREPPLAFLRRSGIAIAGERTAGFWLGLAAFVGCCMWLSDWKSGGVTAALWQRNGWFPFNLPELLAAAGGGIAAAAADPRTLLGTLAIGAATPAFWYTLAYSAVIVIFGIRRMRRRRTPYITAQTVTLMAIQVLPLFLIPELVLPLLHHNGLLPAALADALFPVAGYGHGREFWRAYGLILAWPLNVYNVFTPAPLPWWLAIAALQTCVLIPLAIFRFGKGVYCGWICSCGALAETLGDSQRHKMPHGRGWNRFNLAGQVVLAVAVALLVVRIAGWVLPDGNLIALRFEHLLKERYKWTVDVFLAGVIGYGFYFWFSGRFWCRFLCPLAALMHIYARFSRFAIVADKQRCISCNACTSICHQGIDVMSFANKGVPMQDPQCVRCSACVHACPTGVLQFGEVRRDGSLISVDSLMASPVLMREGAWQALGSRRARG